MGNGKYVIGFSLEKSLDYWKDAVKKGGEGGRGIYIDSAGNSVLVAYDKLKIAGMNWFLISKVDQYEVEAPVRKILIKTLGISVILIPSWGSGSFFYPETSPGPLSRM